MYNIRKTTKNDVDIILDIYDKAKIAMKENNINQWNDNYPSYETIINDINNNESYVLTYDGKIIASAMISSRIDSTYNVIEGKWGNNDKYIVIHRFVVNVNTLNKGIGSLFLTMIIDLFKINTIRIDTLNSNYIMKKLLLKNNFKYRGVIYLENKEPRDAYDKIIDESK